jgi:hypothetical protein
MTLIWLGLGLLAVIGGYVALELRSVRQQRARLAGGGPHSDRPDISRDQQTNESIIRSQVNQINDSYPF